ncbi:translational GTPase TypA [Methylacidimicrobium tartarophylax]|uniref:Large ribosomal subunit assembly factor BipA n=1 Tax=Methylacidimicrobium tartarophylax TaxID=1041768 RepID=A0A5E6M9B3_9BACT|nr:translational GTPase TypA [Methylacidimicrobium tartarophylax]VVM05797.1 GTP-binding protein TypA/BipA [Methylacidimicrobium tartarophylax]
MAQIRNIAIIAHVDHGKTTLVDQLLRQSGTFRSNQAVAERVMDSMDLEREKGITIRAKNASFLYKDYKINLVDTPGHADFGGEVERSLRMVDGVLLLVDAVEGPQAQTKFVLKKALAAGLLPIVILNKVDRENARPNEILDQVFELFLELDATDEQLDFPALYASAKVGFAAREWKGVEEAQKHGMEPLFETILEKVPAPKADASAPFSLLVANLDYSEYVGQLAVGKIYGGQIRVGDPIACLPRDGVPRKARVTQLLGYYGLQRQELTEAVAGDIVAIAGLEQVEIGDTLCDQEDRPSLPRIEVDPPTVRMRLLVNNSPLSGREGKFLTARHLRDRLFREIRTNVGLQVEDSGTGSFEVSGRGEMQIAVLAEQMRREGFELMLSRPEVIYRKDEAGGVLEPLETLYVDLPQAVLGSLLECLARRGAEVENMRHLRDTVFVEAVIPTRGLIGFETELVNMTRGEGIASHLFREYGPKRGEIVLRGNGVLVSMEKGVTTPFALENLQERGQLFVGPGEEVYEGMIVGENARPDDLLVNPCKTKHLTNMRSQGDGKGILLDAPRSLSLEQAIEYIGSEEYVEVTPGKLRLRKKILSAVERRRSEATAGA